MPDGASACLAVQKGESVCRIRRFTTPSDKQAITINDACF